MHDATLGDKFAKGRLLQTHPLPIASRASARRVLMTYTGDTLYPPFQSQSLGPSGKMSTATTTRLPSTRLREHHHQGGGQKPNTRSSGVTKSTPKKGGKRRRRSSAANLVLLSNGAVPVCAAFFSKVPVTCAVIYLRNQETDNLPVGRCLLHGLICKSNKICTSNEDKETKHNEETKPRSLSRTTGFSSLRRIVSSSLRTKRQ